MDGMQRGNAGLACFGLGSATPTAVKLTLLGFTGFERWATALLACPTAARSAAQTVNFSASN